MAAGIYTDEGTAGAMTDGSFAPLPSLSRKVFSSLMMRRVVILGGGVETGVVR
jgi:hypothetical protein